MGGRDVVNSNANHCIMSGQKNGLRMISYDLSSRMKTRSNGGGGERERGRVCKCRSRTKKTEKKWYLKTVGVLVLEGTGQLA